MRRFFLLSLLATGLGGVGFAQQTVIATSSAGAGGLGLYADGAAWPTTNGGFTFDVGVFPAGFDPLTADRATWVSAWLSARQTGGAGAVTSWFRDGSSTYFSITGSSASLRPTDAPGSQYYIWGYNTRTTGAAAEWLLLTNPAWRVVASDLPLVPVLFDTRDAGTVAIVGQLSNGGKDLQSARIFAGGLSITGQMASFSVPVGQPALLAVTAAGSGLSYQWYIGAKGDTTNPVVGATRSSYTVAALTATTRYWVRLSNGVQTVDSETITVTGAGAGAGVTATHRMASLGYIPGQRVLVCQEIIYTGTLSRLDIAALPPAGWSCLGSDGSPAQTRPALGATDLLEWSWTTVPASPFTFSYVLAVPAGAAGGQAVTTLATAVREGVSYQTLLLPDPLVLQAGPQRHSADRDNNNRIELAELTRVIELYNTRCGSVRTGAYRVDGSGEDGYASEATRATSATVTLTAYHTADNSPRDGCISLVELTRVIELYNARAGSVRTGAYFARGDTEDGFAPGSVP